MVLTRATGDLRLFDAVVERLVDQVGGGGTGVPAG